MDRVLTDHQRRVAVALLVEGVPIDLLAEHLGSTGTRSTRLFTTRG